MNTETPQHEDEPEIGYIAIVQGHLFGTPANINQEWNKNGDYFTKFSMYPETHNSIATTETNAVIEL